MSSPQRRTALLIPLKNFDGAKRRLGETVPGSVRRELMRSLARSVLRAGDGFERWVVCDDAEVASFALHHGAQVIWRGGGLNAAVQQAFDYLAQAGPEQIVVAHGDLAFPGTLSAEFINSDPVAPPEIRIAPDRHGEGTNVISVPSDLPFHFAYGPGSLARHCEEANRCGVRATVLTSAELGLDVDTPADLALYRGSQ